MPHTLSVFLSLHIHAYTHTNDLILILFYFRNVLYALEIPLNKPILDSRVWMFMCVCFHSLIKEQRGWTNKKLTKRRAEKNTPCVHFDTLKQMLFIFFKFQYRRHFIACPAVFFILSLAYVYLCDLKHYRFGAAGGSAAVVVWHN